MKRTNTLKKGSVRILVFREADTWYATALEFNIVEAGDTPREVMLLLFEAVEGYLESARKIKARPTIFNQSSDPEYEKKWYENIESKKQSSSVFFAGMMNVMNGRTLMPV